MSSRLPQPDVNSSERSKAPSCGLVIAWRTNCAVAQLAMNPLQQRAPFLLRKVRKSKRSGDYSSHQSIAIFPPKNSTALESVRRLQAGLQSFLSMRRIEARRKNASAFRLRFSQSLASLRQRLSQAIGQNHKSADLIGTFDDFNAEMRSNFCKRFRKFRPLITAVDEQRLQKGKHAEQCRHDENAPIAILNVGRMNDGVEQEA